MTAPRYVLPRDVTLIASRDLDAELRTRLGASDGEFAIDRPGARTTAKLLDANTVALVRQFRRPTTMAHAIVRIAKARGADAVQIVPEAFAALRQLIASGYLFEEGSTALEAIRSTLAPRSMVSQFRIRECVRAMEDVEVYLAEDESNGKSRVAIKRWREVSDDSRTSARREAKTLSRLAGRCAPRLVDASLDHDEPWIAMAWCQGVNVDAAADEARTSPLPVRRARIAEVLRSVCEAYTTVHEIGVIHGDVHGGNCLIDRRGLATLVDFGLARDTMHDTSDYSPRGGVFAFFEPEYAQAILAKKAPPDATFASEQYAIAALLFQLCAGAHYLDFDPSQERAFGQLVSDPPRSFEACGAQPWPALETVLRRALSKNPSERFATTRDFAEAVSAATTEPIASPSSLSSRPPMRDLTRVWRRLAIDSTWARRGYSRAPTCSVAYGAAGAALACYRRAIVGRSAEHLALARHWTAVAEASLDRPNAFYDGDQLTRRNIGTFSTHHGEMGVWLTSMLISHASGDERGMRAAAARWRTLSRSRRREIDLTLGRAGVVNSGAMLVSLLAPAWPRMAASIRLRAAAEHDALVSETRAYDRIGDPRCRRANLGIAHGWAGLLLALLRWRAADKATPEVDTEITRRLDELSACAVPSGRGLRWPWHDVITEGDDQHSYIGGWCNGSAGLTHLWLESFETFRRPAYLELAHGAAWNTWEYDDDAVESLCCGLAGRSYALLAVYRATGDVAWYDRARELAARAAESVRLDHPEALSLYRGALGVALLSEEIDDAHTARMPAFEMERWSLS